MRFQSIAILAGLGAALAGCNTVDRLRSVGTPPPMTPMSVRSALPVAPALPAQIVAADVPQSAATHARTNSLWAPGARSFFKDQRATKAGDIVTVKIDIADKAQVSNQTARSRKAEEGANVTNILGLENTVKSIMPSAFDPAAALNLGSDSSTQGSGAVNREEKVELTVAAIVTHVLPNGNLVLEGRQEVRVNFERRDLIISGIVRPEDISATNEVKHTQMAEARISYGGQGHLTDVQQPRYGQQVVDILFPF